MEQSSSPQSEPSVFRDEAWALLHGDDAVRAVQAEPSHRGRGTDEVLAELARRGLTGSELLTELARRGRHRPTAYERRMASEDAHRMNDFD